MIVHIYVQADYIYVYICNDLPRLGSRVASAGNAGEMTTARIKSANNVVDRTPQFAIRRYLFWFFWIVVGQIHYRSLTVYIASFVRGTRVNKFTKFIWIYVLLHKLHKHISRMFRLGDCA